MRKGIGQRRFLCFTGFLACWANIPTSLGQFTGETIKLKFRERALGGGRGLWGGGGRGNINPPGLIMSIFLINVPHFLYMCY